MHIPSCTDSRNFVILDLCECIHIHDFQVILYFQTLATDGAQAATTFTISGSTYFVIANSGKQGTRVIQSMVYRLYSNGTVEMVKCFLSVV